jgi:hypothetical protein
MEVRGKFRRDYIRGNLFPTIGNTISINDKGVDGFMFICFQEWEKDKEESITYQGKENEGYINEEQQPEFDTMGTALNEL